MSVVSVRHNPVVGCYLLVRDPPGGGSQEILFCTWTSQSHRLEYICEDCISSFPRKATCDSRHDRILAELESGTNAHVGKTLSLSQHDRLLAAWHDGEENFLITALEIIGELSGVR